VRGILHLVGSVCDSSMQAALRKCDQFGQPVEFAAAPERTYPRSCAPSDASPSEVPNHVDARRREARELVRQCGGRRARAARAILATDSLNAPLLLAYVAALRDRIYALGAQLNRATTTNQRNQ
jgi:hypothetical protein